jgi:hypothetical protein
MTEYFKSIFGGNILFFFFSFLSFVLIFISSTIWSFSHNLGLTSFFAEKHESFKKERK